MEERTVFLVEYGILLDPKDPNNTPYTSVYDKRNGYCTELQFYRTGSYSEVFNEVKNYVKNGLNDNYGIISFAEVSMKNDVNLNSNETIPMYEKYKPENVLCSIVKHKGEVIQNFIQKQRLEIKRKGGIF